MAGRWSIALLVIICSGIAFYFYDRPAASDVEPLGELTPITARKRIPTQTGVPAKLIPLNSQGNPQRTITQQDLRIELDLSTQSVSVEVPDLSETRYGNDVFYVGDTVQTTTADVELLVDGKPVTKLPQGVKLPVTKVEKDRVFVSVRIAREVKSGSVSNKQIRLTATEPQINVVPTTRDDSKFVSGAMLIQKGKQFDDGLYAAVELAAQNGLGSFGGKKKLLATLTAALGERSPTHASGVIAGAAMLGGAISSPPEKLRDAANTEVHDFRENPLVSKPIGFYTWNDQLSAIFRQDRLLQTGVSASGGAEDTAQVLRSNAEARATYVAYVDLIERLTNPSDFGDLREFVADGSGPIPSTMSLRFIPPSRSYETALLNQLYGKNPVPEGFDLMNELVSRIQSGKLNVTPTDRSGWYDHQTYALAALLQPPLPHDPRRLSFGPRYQRHLVELFKGALALTRETHIKQLEIPTAASSRPMRPKIYLSPEFSVEPLPEMYRRRAESYRFIRTVLEKAFGAPALAEMHRQTAEGFVETNLDVELRQMTEIFDGAALVTARELGLPSLDAKKRGGTEAEVSPQSIAAADNFLQWAAATASDDDLARDSRMMVPVFFDAAREKTKVWGFLGWQTRRIDFTLGSKPSVKVFNAEGKTPTGLDDPELIWHDVSKTIATPVMAEVYVTKLLNRDEFRKHCDAFVTRSAILENLE